MIFKKINLIEYKKFLKKINLIEYKKLTCYNINSSLRAT